MRNMLRFRNPMRKLRAKGDAARDARQWPLAIALYETYLSDDQASRDAPIWVQLGHARKETGDDEGAMRAYRRSVELAPEVADTHLQIGHLLKKTGQLDLALDSYSEALRLDANSAHARDEAARLAATAGTAPPGPSAGLDPADSLLARAHASRDGHRWPEAVEHYTAFLELHPDDQQAGPIWVQLGHARREAGDHPGALQAYQRAAALAPKAPEPHLHLANLKDEMGDLKAAIATIAEALRLDPSHAPAMLRLQQLTLRAATLPAGGHGFDGDDQVHVAHPAPRPREQVAFDPVFPTIYPGLSRRFKPA